MGKGYEGSSYITAGEKVMQLQAENAALRSRIEAGDRLADAVGKLGAELERHGLVRFHVEVASEARVALGAYRLARKGTEGP